MLQVHEGVLLYTELSIFIEEQQKLLSAGGFLLLV